MPAGFRVMPGQPLDFNEIAVAVLGFQLIEAGLEDGVITG